MTDDNKIASRHVLIDYTNHAGVRQQRTIVPDIRGIFFSSSQWHPEEQWLLNAFDIGKEAPRTFALKDINSWLPADSRSARVERSIAKRLQESLERGNRMELRLKKIVDQPRWHSGDSVVVAIESVLKDEDPA